MITNNINKCTFFILFIMWLFEKHDKINLIDKKLTNDMKGSEYV